jgi:hypothetical protein
MPTPEHPRAGDTPRGAAVTDTPTTKVPDPQMARIRAMVVQDINRRTPGTVTLHYAARDVEVVGDGDMGFRLMTVFRRQRADGLDDPIDHRTLAVEGRIMVGFDGLLAVSWAPGPDADEAVGKGMFLLLDRIDQADNLKAFIDELVAAGLGGDGALADIAERVAAAAGDDPDIVRTIDEMRTTGGEPAEPDPTGDQP